MLLRRIPSTPKVKQKWYWRAKNVYLKRSEFSSWDNWINIIMNMMQQSQDQKCQDKKLRMKRVFQMKQKTFLIIYKGQPLKGLGLGL